MASTNVNKYISSRLYFGERNFEVKPVGAWVQPNPDEVDVVESATVSAQFEENRIRNIQHEKDEKLKRFQDEVRLRVQALQKAKAQQQLQKSYKAVESERNIIRQSASAAEKTNARKNSCKIRSDQEHVLSAQPAPELYRTENKTMDGKEDGGIYEEQSHQVHAFTAAARKSLVSRRLAPSRGIPIQAEVSPSQEIKHQDENMDFEENGLRETCENRLGNGVTDEAASGDGPNQKSRGVKKQSKGYGHAPAAVRVSVPDIYPGIAGEEERQQAMTQRAIYRRMFMDQEREQVRDAVRRREHRKRIHIIKREKEEERKRIEDAAVKILEPVDPLTGQSAEERLEIELSQMQELQISQEQSQRRVQKKTETERFVGALRSRLREKMALRQVELPALCCCGDTIWDTSPDTCANNCVFYKNPRAYAKALQCVLASCEAV